MQTETIWNDIYSKGPQTSSGKPGLALSQFVGPLRVGTALELGCARGDDAVWLARQGWHVTAVDVSYVALDIASRNALAAGVLDRTTKEISVSPGRGAPILWGEVALLGGTDLSRGLDKLDAQVQAV